MLTLIPKPSGAQHVMRRCALDAPRNPGTTSAPIHSGGPLYSPIRPSRAGTNICCGGRRGISSLLAASGGGGCPSVPRVGSHEPRSTTPSSSLDPFWSFPTTIAQATGPRGGSLAPAWIGRRDGVARRPRTWQSG